MGAFSRGKEGALTAEAKLAAGAAPPFPVLRSRPPSPPHARRPCGNCFALGRSNTHRCRRVGTPRLGAGSTPRPQQPPQSRESPQRTQKKMAPTLSPPIQTNGRTVALPMRSAGVPPHPHPLSRRPGPVCARALTFADFPLSSGREEAPGRALARGQRDRALAHGQSPRCVGLHSAGGELPLTGVCGQHTAVMGNVCNSRSTLDERS